MRLALALISDSGLHDVVTRQLQPLAVEFSCAFEPGDFWDMLPKRPYDAVIAEQAILSANASAFVERVKRVHPGASVVLIGDGDEDASPSAGRTALLRLPMAEGALARAFARKEPVCAEADPLKEFKGSSPAIADLKERIRLFAGSDSTVMVLGESGVGKEMVARAIHALSARRSGPFVAVNCGAIPSEIIESELFGHVKGAFTGADRDRSGQFELACGGTLFLDEIGTMRPDHQVRLLRVLQEPLVTPVGATNRIRVDVRVMAATNADLDTLMDNGLFRTDLFYRLNVLVLSVPPLRERREDIPELARHFLRRYAERSGLREKQISPTGMERLVHHPWRGNVRELENAIEHAMVVSRGRLVIENMDLPGLIGDRRSGVDRSVVRLTPEGVDLNDTVTRIERDMILQSLALSGGNKSRAAELLRLKRTTFIEKMRRLELFEEEPEVSV